jgi:hypothetical protein
MHVKPLGEQRSSQAEHVKLCHDLLRCNQKLPCFRRVLLCFTTNMSARAQPFLDLARACSNCQQTIVMSLQNHQKHKGRKLRKSFYVFVPFCGEKTNWTDRLR